MAQPPLIQLPRTANGRNRILAKPIKPAALAVRTAVDKMDSGPTAAPHASNMPLHLEFGELDEYRESRVRIHLQVGIDGICESACYHRLYAGRVQHMRRFFAVAFFHPTSPQETSGTAAIAYFPFANAPSLVLANRGAVLPAPQGVVELGWSD